MADARSVTTPLADWAFALRWEDIPARVQEDVRTVWMDTFGCMLLGARNPETVQLSQVLAARDPHGRIAAAAGTEVWQTPQNAVLVNALAAGVDVFDGGNIASRGHVPGYVMPAVMTAAEQAGATLGEALTAFVAGYEIAARIGAACVLHPEMHPSSTWGQIGAAAAVARLRGASARDIARHMDLAANLTFATSWNAAANGANVRSLYSALPSYMGMVVADLAAAGFDGGPAAVEVTFGKISASAFSAERCLAGLGETWLMDETYLKLYPCCRNFQGSLDALFEVTGMRRMADLPPDAVIEVGADPLAIRDNTEVHNSSILAAKESLPVSIALALAHGAITPELYANGEHTKPEIVELARRVVIRQADRAVPSDRPGWFALGEEKSAVTRPLGNPGRPIPKDSLLEKFVTNAGPILGAAAPAVAKEMLVADVHLPFRTLYHRWFGNEPKAVAV